MFPSYSLYNHVIRLICIYMHKSFATTAPSPSLTFRLAIPCCDSHTAGPVKPFYVALPCLPRYINSLTLPLHYQNTEHLPGYPPPCSGAGGVVTNDWCIIIKVRKRARIRNRYNQASHLTEDTNGIPMGK